MNVLLFHTHADKLMQTIHTYQNPCFCKPHRQIATAATAAAVLQRVTTLFSFKYVKGSNQKTKDGKEKSNIVFNIAQ